MFFPKEQKSNSNSLYIIEKGSLEEVIMSFSKGENQKLIKEIKVINK